MKKIKVKIVRGGGALKTLILAVSALLLLVATINGFYSRALANENNFYDSNQVPTVEGQNIQEYNDGTLQVTSQVFGNVDPITGVVSFTDQITLTNLTSDMEITFNSVSAKLNSGFEGADIKNWEIKNSESTLFSGTAGTQYIPDVVLDSKESKIFNVSTGLAGLNAGALVNTIPFNFAYDYEAIRADKAYACLYSSNSENDTLEFRYDNEYVNYTKWWDCSNTGTSTPGWKTYIGSSGTVNQIIICPSFAYAKPKSLYIWFSNCKEGISIEGLDKITTEETTTLASTFAGCPFFSDSISSQIKTWNVNNVTTLESTFSSTPISNTNFLRDWDTHNIISLNGTFSNCPELVDISGLYKWNTSKVEYMSNTFKKCKSLVSLRGLENWKTENVTHFCNFGKSTTDATGMFSYCENLINTEEIKNWNVENAEYFGGMFRSCSNLTIANLSGWKTQKAKYFVELYWRVTFSTPTNGMFQDCSNLEVVYLNSLDLSGKPYVDIMFTSCSKLKNIYCSLDFNGHALFVDSRVTNNSLFYNCISLPHFNSSKIDLTYAYPDNGETGYFTMPEEQT